ncbi:MAG: HIT family protein [Candidatus Bathyarchaeia archaeon]
MERPCVFCSIIRGDAFAHRVYEDERVLAFLDINPCSPGHTLLIPKAHVGRLENLSEGDAIALFLALHRLTGSIQRAVGAPATTIGINNGPESGQEVPHLHIHIIPRFKGDRGGIIQSVARGYKRLSGEEMNKIAERIREAIREASKRGD